MHNEDSSLKKANLRIADSDFVPALQFARREGMQVGRDPLWANIRPELAEHIDWMKTRIPNPSGAGP